MADYYVDPAAGGDNDGGGDGAALDPTDANNWTDAWVSIQSAFTNAVAGDTVFCRGTQLINTDGEGPITTAASGSQASGYIKFVGCAANGSVDGTRFCIDAEDTETNCISAGVHTYIWMENIELKQAAGDGYTGVSGTDYWVWVNCISHDHDGDGWNLTSNDNHLFVKCQGYNNTADGFADGVHDNVFFLCVAYANSSDGIVMGGTGAVINSIMHSNGSRGIYVAAGNTIYNCVADGNAVGLYGGSDGGVILGNRITNNTTVGFDLGDELNVCGWNLFHGNNANNDRDNPDSWDWEGVYAAYICDESLDTTGGGTNDDDHGDADDGYSGRATDDFNLKTDRTYNGDGTDTVGLNIGS